MPAQGGASSATDPPHCLRCSLPPFPGALGRNWWLPSGRTLHLYHRPPRLREALSLHLNAPHLDFLLSALLPAPSFSYSKARNHDQKFGGNGFGLTSFLGAHVWAWIRLDVFCLLAGFACRRCEPPTGFEVLEIRKVCVHFKFQKITVVLGHGWV